MTSIKPQTNNLLILQKFILDPLSTIIKLAILGKKSVGCKISIKNNQIYIQEAGVFQGVARYYMGNTKNDIHFLSIPIELACKRYLTLEKITEIPNIITIFTCAQQGLNNLMTTYITFPIVVHCLKYYYSIINNHLHLISCERTKSLENNLDKKNNVPQNSFKINKPEEKLVTKPKKNKEINLYNHHSQQFNNNLETTEMESFGVRETTETIEPNEKKDTKIEEKGMVDKKDETETTDTTDSENELLLLYTDEILNKFDLIWEKSKIQIVINMIDYLIGEKSASEYAGCIETFMIPIDKESLNIIYENPNITSE